MPKESWKIAMLRRRIRRPLRRRMTTRNLRHNHFHRRFANLGLTDLSTTDLGAAIFQAFIAELTGQDVNDALKFYFIDDYGTDANAMAEDLTNLLLETDGLDDIEKAANTAIHMTVKEIKSRI